MSFAFTWSFVFIACIILVVTMMVMSLTIEVLQYQTFGSERFEWWRLILGIVYFVIALGLFPKPVSEFSEYFTCGFLGGGLLCGVSALVSIIFQVMAYRHFIRAWVNRFVLQRPDEPIEEGSGVKRDSWLPTVVTAFGVAGAIYSCTAVLDQQYMKAVREITAEEMRRHRNDWGLVPGVAEARVGAAIGWVAVDPHIYIDWVYEKQLGNNAERSIPLRVVLLNNSFTNVILDSRDNNLWRAWVTRAGSDRVLREWTQSALEKDKIQLYPAQRLDFVIDWNGRDESGALIGPGTYEIHLETAVVESEGHSIRALAQTHLDDTGPDVKIIRDPIVEYVERAIEHQKLSDMMRKSMRESEDLRNSLNQLIYGR